MAEFSDTLPLYIKANGKNDISFTSTNWNQNKHQFVLEVFNQNFSSNLVSQFVEPNTAYTLGDKRIYKYNKRTNRAYIVQCDNGGTTGSDPIQITLTVGDFGVNLFNNTGSTPPEPSWVVLSEVDCSVYFIKSQDKSTFGYGSMNMSSILQSIFDSESKVYFEAKLGQSNVPYNERIQYVQYCISDQHRSGNGVIETNREIQECYVINGWWDIDDKNNSTNLFGLKYIMDATSGVYDYKMLTDSELITHNNNVKYDYILLPIDPDSETTTKNIMIYDYTQKITLQNQFSYWENKLYSNSDTTGCIWATDGDNLTIPAFSPGLSSNGRSQVVCQRTFISLATDTLPTTITIDGLFEDISVMPDFGYTIKFVYSTNPYNPIGNWSTLGSYTFDPLSPNPTQPTTQFTINPSIVGSSTIWWLGFYIESENDITTLQTSDIYVSAVDFTITRPVGYRIFNSNQNTTLVERTLKSTLISSNGGYFSNCVTSAVQDEVWYTAVLNESFENITPFYELHNDKYCNLRKAQPFSVQWKNTLGGYDNEVMYLVDTEEAVKKTSIDKPLPIFSNRMDRGFTTVLSARLNKLTLVTNWIDKSKLEYLKNMLMSKNVTILQDGIYKPYIINDVTYKTINNTTELYQLVVDFTYANTTFV